MSDQIQPVILSGGSGSRLWPLSRSARPKQFIPFVHDKSLFQHTISRVSSRYGFGDAIIIANEAHRFLVEEELFKNPDISGDIILEPFAKNTAPAILTACLHALQKGDDQLVLILPADHKIDDMVAFHQMIERAAPSALKGEHVCFGMHADYAEAGYGYIERGQRLSGFGYKVSQFKEKPNAETAKSYIESGDYYWNSGMFLFKAAAVLQEFETLDPNMLSLVRQSYEEKYQDLSFIRLEAEAFNQIKGESIDYALMEKTQHATVFPAQIGWSDLGSYTSLLNASEQDQNGNVIKGSGKTIKTQNTYIHSNDGLVAAVGVNDLAIVKMDDVTLVADLQHDQDVKLLVEELKHEKNDIIQYSSKVHRPWGSFEGLVTSDRYQVKEIIVKPGKRLSLQSHNHRAEHWVIVSGTATVTRDEEEFLLTEDQSIYLPLGCKHRLENKGKIPLKLIEVQTGSYLGEDDIVRYEDDFKRSSDD